MKRVRQSVEEILSSLIPIEADWCDAHAEGVIRMLRGIPVKTAYLKEDVAALLDSDFEIASTVIRMFLDLSKDEYEICLKALFGGPPGHRVMRYRRDGQAYLEGLTGMGLLDRMNECVNRKLSWSELLVERLKGGRGSAIKGQSRGRGLEDFVQSIIEGVFENYQIFRGCRFVGATGLSTEKTDFAIPSAEDPHILVEVKAYGATGSKQTDVLGDVHRIIEEKRDDTVFILFTDGITWRERANDLRKLIELQNRGKIRRIVTKSMADEFRADLEAMKVHFGL